MNTIPQNKGGFSCLHDNAVNDGKGQWNLKTHGTAESRRAFNIQRAADRLNVLDYYIHTHSTARIFRNLFVGRKARKRDQLVHFFI